MKRSLWMLAAFLVACAPAADPAAPAAPAEPVAAQTAPAPTAPAASPYDWNRPAATLRLAPTLQEISGLTVLPDGRLAAVQDEDGVVYTLDPATGAIVAERTFGGPGDYEGIEATPGALYVLRSNGTLHELPDGQNRATEHDTPLGGRCDAEGLGYDASKNRLLIACKGDPGKGLGDVRAVYAFDLNTRTMADTPAFTLSRDALDDGKKFKPSALAVHPVSGQIYLLSSSKAIAVLTPDGTLDAVFALDASQHEQPEGLAFAPDGTLYLSNEGGDGAATLMRFDPQQR